MHNDSIELFVPGRLCLMGEHSDWAGGYRKINHEIEKGYAIVTGIEEGIYATATKDNDLVVEFKNSDKQLRMPMDKKLLKETAESGEYWSYVAGVAYCIKEQYDVGGVKITIENETIPEKKGLSSSAAICVLVTRAFNLLYDLKLNTIGEMNIAYLGEITTPSRCGRLDQACAFGKRPILMTFDGDKLDVDEIKVGEDLHFVFADLMAHKDTIKILGDLNKCFPFASDEKEKNVQKCLGTINKENIFEALEYIENGEVEKLGELMNKAQQDFDTLVAPACYDELKAEVLHKTMQDETVRSLSYGVKGVGSQGDGTIQMLAKDEDSQIRLKQYLEEQLGMHAFTLTIEKTCPIKKAIIPVAGNGTRMFPITKIIPKPFLPVVDHDNIIKPAFMHLLEELDDAGIKEIALVIDRDQQLVFEKFFEKTKDPAILNKLSNQTLDYDNRLFEIGKKITYIIQEEKRGFGHAVSLCSAFANNEPVLLMLGDQLYKSNEQQSCTSQLLENFAKTNSATITVCEVPLETVGRYGILYGKEFIDDRSFNITKMIEKPQLDIAKEELCMNKGGEDKYYAVFGEYILTPEVFSRLQYNVDNNITEQGEIQLTSVLSDMAIENKLMAYIPNGKMYDIGNVTAYKDCFINLTN
ncbi:GHMP kinase [Candidatus Saccharibacteria bacterium]|nr:GHMP kinase [Candidatus Saccharibacteria bacterium]